MGSEEGKFSKLNRIRELGDRISLLYNGGVREKDENARTRQKDSGTKRPEHELRRGMTQERSKKNFGKGCIRSKKVERRPPLQSWRPENKSLRGKAASHTSKNRVRQCALSHRRTKQPLVWLWRFLRSGRHGGKEAGGQEQTSQKNTA